MCTRRNKLTAGESLVSPPPIIHWKISRISNLDMIHAYIGSRLIHSIDSQHSIPFHSQFIYSAWNTYTIHTQYGSTDATVRPTNESTLRQPLFPFGFIQSRHVSMKLHHSDVGTEPKTLSLSLFGIYNQYPLPSTISTCLYVNLQSFSMEEIFSRNVSLSLSLSLSPSLFRRRGTKNRPIIFLKKGGSCIHYDQNLFWAVVFSVCIRIFPSFCIFQCLCFPLPSLSILRGGTNLLFEQNATHIHTHVAQTYISLLSNHQT